eukprot:CAMPEP_0172189496 /NCGR_PEP_ID=MMETSP1050-20130122/22555_1 /TAXON_ID=233186 /ORGANISM="Cryptomonas curvata, Strain CCAP979/52" /LENGTH=295 /DNA_ID=CAMNT_0012864195 /DNA_START=112 /DNA_END=996 /DNA_ORIENTATION=+
MSSFLLDSFLKMFTSMQCISIFLLAVQFAAVVSFQMATLHRGPKTALKCSSVIQKQRFALVSVRPPLAKPVLRMAVGDIISLEWGAVSDAQEGIRAAMADGHRLIEVEVPTTNKFKDKALNQIYQANTEYARELVRMFTQPGQLRIVFPDESEGRIALETYGEVPFSIGSLAYLSKDEAVAREVGLAFDKYVVMNPVFDVREYIQTEQLYRGVVAAKGGTMIVFNGELFRLRTEGLTGYYPDIFFPKLAEARKRMMPQVTTAYYLKVFRGPPVGALYRRYPGPWQILRPVDSAGQ